MSGVFLYGTLRHLSLLETVLRRSVASSELISAEFDNHRTVWALGQGFPLILPAAGQTASGLLLHSPSDEDLALLDYYEGGFGYVRGPISVRLASGELVVTTIWWPPTAGVTPGAAFDLSDWAAQWGAINARAASEIMGYRGQLPASKVASMFAMIQARSASWVRAQGEGVPPTPPASQPVPQTQMRRGDVKVEHSSRPYAEYFAVEEQVLSYRKFDGDFSDPVHRGVLLTPDVALVLPYDPKRDRVLLVEQFRMGPWVRGDQQPWQYESVAGRIDPGETPQDCARREAKEEAGLELKDLIEIHQGYASPGCSMEYYYSYLALSDLPDDLAAVGGLKSEAEDIRSHLLSFEAVMALFEQGELRVMPVAMAVLWLAQNRERLRRDA